MSMGADFLNTQGVLQGPFGSLIREQYGVDNANPESVFSSRGRRALFEALLAYRSAGATIGGAPTFRLTDHRAGDNPRAWEYEPGTAFPLDPVTRERNMVAVAIAKAVFEDRIVGQIAPVADTSGKHDKHWNNLGDHAVDWAMQRQRGQVENLCSAGVPVIWGEAFRYRDEAIAVARLAKEFGAQALAINFEANAVGIPDPQNSGSYTFRCMKQDLQAEAGPAVRILVGANCTGISNIRKIWERGDHVDIAYPNSLNFGDGEKSQFADLVENSQKTSSDYEKMARMQADRHTRLIDFVNFWKEAFHERGVIVSGGCCGTTPEHTKMVKRVLVGN